MSPVAATRTATHAFTASLTSAISSAKDSSTSSGGVDPTKKRSILFLVNRHGKAGITTPHPLARSTAPSKVPPVHENTASDSTPSLAIVVLTSHVPHCHGKTHPVTTKEHNELSKKIVDTKNKQTLINKHRTTRQIAAQPPHHYDSKRVTRRFKKEHVTSRIRRGKWFVAAPALNNNLKDVLMVGHRSIRVKESGTKLAEDSTSKTGTLDEDSENA